MKIKRLALVTMAILLLVSATATAETTIDTIMNAGTTQAFTEEAVSTEDLNTILQAGLSTASAINQQPWFFVAITNQDVMAEIAGSGMSFTPPSGSFEKPDGASDDAGSFPAAPAMSGGAKAGLGDSPAAIIIYRNDASKSPNANFDCGLAAQNMYIAAAALGYGVKIVSSPTMSLNGENHDAICEKLGVDPAMQAVAVLLIGHADSTVDATSGATTRESMDTRTSIIE